MDFSEFEKKINIKFKNKGLLKQAFTHRSYLNENPSWPLGHNERLEFLGDAVLELVITEYLFKSYPEKAEGEMTGLRAALVNSKMLADVASSLDMEKFLLLSRGEAKDSGRARQYILANTFEALTGAIYLDREYDGVVEFLNKTVMSRAKDVIEKKLWIDSKSLFQEKAQEYAGTTPSYKVLQETGPDHAKKFVIGVFLNDQKVGEGEGISKQEAEQEAARHALELKKWKD